LQEQDKKADQNYQLDNVFFVHDNKLGLISLKSAL